MANGQQSEERGGRGFDRGEQRSCPLPCSGLSRKHPAGRQHRGGAVSRRKLPGEMPDRPRGFLRARRRCWSGDSRPRTAGCNSSVNSGRRPRNMHQPGVRSVRPQRRRARSVGLNSRLDRARPGGAPQQKALRGGAKQIRFLREGERGALRRGAPEPAPSLEGVRRGAAPGSAPGRARLRGSPREETPLHQRAPRPHPEGPAGPHRIRPAKGRGGVPPRANGVYSRSASRPGVTLRHGARRGRERDTVIE